MNKRFLVCVALIPMVFASQLVAARETVVDVADTERRADRLTYKVGSDAPFSGLVRVFYSPKKKKSEFRFVDGTRDGVSVRWYENGNKQSEETYSAGVLHGVVNRWFKSGERQFSGEFVNGRPEGARTDYHPNGKKKLESILVGGKVNGVKVIWFESGIKQQEANMLDGKFHGLVTTWYDDGQKESEENWVQGENEQDGVFNKWDGLGDVIAEGNYESGKFTGRKLEYTINGLATEEIFVDGKRVEYAETLGQEFANGQLRGEQRWIDGKRQETFWFENGQMERHSTVHANTENGRWQEWYENGQRKSDYLKKFDIKEGPVLRWYENGQARVHEIYLHGRKHGIQMEWHEDGRIKSESVYKYGRLLNADGEPEEPVPPSVSVNANTDTDVTYSIHTGSLRFWNTTIQSVSDGTISGNTAIVAPGAMVQLAGNWQIGPPVDPMPCPSCNLQLYVSWIPDAAARGAWMPSHPLWHGMPRAVEPGSEPGGSFDWTTQAPTDPGIYYIGRGQSKDYYVRRQTEGRPGKPTNNAEGKASASFRIEVRNGQVSKK